MGNLTQKPLGGILWCIRAKLSICANYLLMYSVWNSNVVPEHWSFTCWTICIEIKQGLWILIMKNMTFSMRHLQQHYLTGNETLWCFFPSLFTHKIKSNESTIHSQILTNTWCPCSQLAVSDRDGPFRDGMLLKHSGCMPMSHRALAGSPMTRLCPRCSLTRRCKCPRPHLAPGSDADCCRRGSQIWKDIDTHTWRLLWKLHSFLIFFSFFFYANCKVMWVYWTFEM